MHTDIVSLSSQSLHRGPVHCPLEETVHTKKSSAPSITCTVRLLKVTIHAEAVYYPETPFNQVSRWPEVPVRCLLPGPPVGLMG